MFERLSTYPYMMSYQKKECACGKTFKNNKRDANIVKHFNTCEMAPIHTSLPEIQSFFKPKKSKKQAVVDTNETAHLTNDVVISYC